MEGSGSSSTHQQYAIVSPRQHFSVAEALAREIGASRNSSLSRTRPISRSFGSLEPVQCRLNAIACEQVILLEVHAHEERGARFSLRIKEHQIARMAFQHRRRGQSRVITSTISILQVIWRR